MLLLGLGFLLLLELALLLDSPPGGTNPATASEAEIQQQRWALHRWLGRQLLG
jgi:hypothetical protein